MNSLASLLLQGSSSDSCQNDKNPLSALSRTFDQQPHSQHQFQSTRNHHHQQPIRTTSDQLIIQQQLTQEQHNSQPVPPQLSEQFRRLQLGNRQSDWSTAFLKSVPIQSFLHSEHSPSNDHHPPWQSEFTQPHHSSKLAHQQAPIPTRSNILPSTSQLGPSAFSQLGPLTPHHHPYHPIRSTHLISHGSSIQNPTITPAVDWDSAFLKYDVHDAPTTTVAEIQHRIEQDQINQASTFLSRSHSPISSTSPDALAKTAASLIATVENGQRAHNLHEDQATSSPNANDTATADKFSQSSFMEFMRQLRDGEVKVEGDKVVQQLAPVKGSSSTVDTSTQMNNSIDHLQQQTHPRLSTNNHPQNLQSFGISEDPISKQYHPAQLNDQPSYQAMMNRFQGDGGGLSDLDDILNAASEVDRPEKQTWTNTATHVPGATESWTEEFDQAQGTSTGTSAREQEGSDFDEMGMFGRPIHAREFELERLKRLQRLPSAQQQEWEKLQSDWETMANTLEDSALDYSTTSTNAISPAIYLERIMALKAETGYNFQQANPHIFLRQDQTNRSKHHSIHQPWQESTLEHPSISPLESVLQKEKEVLSKPESATAWYELGVKQQENEREEMAIQALQHAIKLDPELSDAILALAISYSNENRRAEAFEEIERWIRVETSRVPKYRQAALGQPPSQLNNSTDDPKNGAIEESLKLGVKHGELTNRLIELARLGGRMAGTASVDPDVQIALGVLFNSNDEFEKACDCFSTALAVRPDDPLLFNRLGATLANSGKPEEAIEYYNKAIELLPSYIRARYNLSISLINLGKYFESIKNLLDSLIIQQQASSSLYAPVQHPGQFDHQGPLHLLSGAEQQQSGVTSDVLWQTLEINCSLLKNHFAESQAALDNCFLNKDLDRLKEILADFL